MPKITERDFTLVTNNSAGHPRYVLHFLHLNTQAEADLDIIEKYGIALRRARAYHGKKFSNRQYGGGIAFVTWALDDLVKQLNDMMRRAEAR